MSAGANRLNDLPVVRLLKELKGLLSVVSCKNKSVKAFSCLL